MIPAHEIGQVKRPFGDEALRRATFRKMGPCFRMLHFGWILVEEVAEASELKLRTMIRAFQNDPASDKSP